jgi:serine protease AprX
VSVPLHDPDEVRSARADVRQVLGSRVEEKASNRYCIAFARRSRAVGVETLAAVQASVPAVATVVEFTSPRPMPTLPRLTERADWPHVKEAVETLATPDSAGSPMRLRTVVRQKYVEDTRAAAYQVMGQVYQEVERLSGGLMKPAAEVLGDPEIPTAVTQLCWLNQTMRTFAPPEALTEVAAADAVAAFDLPRRLLADADVPNHRCIGLPAFQQQHPKLTGHGVTVAVIDGEVALTHPALAGRVVQRRNYTPEPWGNPSPHGTAVGGIIAAADPQFGGIAPEATIYSYKVLATSPLGNGDDFSGARAIQDAVEDGADIANCSWGAGPAGDGTNREARAAAAAWSLGLAVVKSAGNQGPGPGTMTSPADAPGIMVVGATDIDGLQVQDYSSRGPAGGKPGPDVVAPGGSTAASISCCLVGGGFGDAGTGTSYAAPHVSGLLALFLEDDPDLIPDQLKERLLATPHVLPAVGPDAQGAGLVWVGQP